MIYDRLDSGVPLSIKVTGVPLHGLISSQFLDDASLKEDEVAEVVETSHALEYGEEDAGPWVTRRKVETDAFFRTFFFFLKYADMKIKDVGTCAASWKCAWSLLPTARGSSEDALKLEAHSVNSTPYRTHFAHATFSRVWLKIDYQIQ